jgi:hypothetical protein
MTLTQEERDKFAQYLEETARDNKALEQQLERLHPTDEMRKRLRIEEMAARVIAKKLRETESV